MNDLDAVDRLLELVADRPREPILGGCDTCGQLWTDRSEGIAHNNQHFDHLTWMYDGQHRGGAGPVFATNLGVYNWPKDGPHGDLIYKSLRR